MPLSTYLLIYVGVAGFFTLFFMMLMFAEASSVTKEDLRMFAEGLGMILIWPLVLTYLLVVAVRTLVHHLSKS